MERKLRNIYLSCEDVSIEKIKVNCCSYCDKKCDEEEVRYFVKKIKSFVEENGEIEDLEEGYHGFKCLRSGDEYAANR